MKLTHLQSSTQIIQFKNIKILSDPWLTGGEYYGSWYHYPPFPEEKINDLDIDYIYVSHIHPDHISVNTFNKISKKIPVLIHHYEHKYLKRKIESMGFEVIECMNGEPFNFDDGGSITIYAADNCNPESCAKFMGCSPVESKYGSTQIDTLAVFKYGERVILNTNDCPYELASETIEKNKINQNQIDLLLVGYAGAGPYPQCFNFKNDEERDVAALKKKKQFLNSAEKYIELVKPKYVAPFAGTYILGSKMVNMNEHRGVPSLVEAVKYLSEEISLDTTVIELQMFDQINLDSGILIKGEYKPSINYKQYLDEISYKKLDYDDDNWCNEEFDILMKDAFQRFVSKANEIGFFTKTKIAIKTKVVEYILDLDARQMKEECSDLLRSPFVKIEVDHNLLNRLIRGPRYAHWNNAEIGSHLRFYRSPNVFERGLYHCLCYFHA